MTWLHEESGVPVAMLLTYFPVITHILSVKHVEKLLCFGGQLTLTFKVKFNFKVKIDPILSLSKLLLTTYSS